MAEILIKAAAARQLDARKAARCYQVGDPVVVMPDGHVWGRAESLPDFWVLKLPGVSVEEASAFLARGEDDTRRRQWSLPVADLPANARAHLRDGVLTATRAQAQAWLRRKVD